MKMRRNRSVLCCVLFACAAVMLGASAARASTVIYSNTSSADSRQVFDNQWLASTFFTDASTSGPYTLTASPALVGLTVYSPSFTQDSNTFFAALYSDSGSNTPGSLIASLSGDTDPDDSGSAHYDYSGDVTLSASTRYWIVLGDTSPDAGNVHDYQVEFGNGADSVGTSGLQLMASQNQGATWAANVAATNVNSRIRMDVSVSAVPEPSSLLLCGVGLMAIARRRRRIA